MIKDTGTAAPQAASGRSYAEITMERLRYGWGEAYEFGDDDGKVRALRRDGIGEAITADDPDQLWRLVRADYDAKPVPRDLPGGGR